MSTISSSTTTTTAYTVSADTTGTLVIQTGATPTTAVTVNTSGALGVGSSPSYGTSGQVLTSAGSSAVPTWSTPSAGKVLQVVSTTLTTNFSTTSDTFVDLTGLSLSITPSSSSNKVLLFLNLSMTAGIGNVVALYQYVRGSTAIGIGTQSGATNQVSGGVYNDPSVSSAAVFTYINSHYLDSPATTSSTTYKIQLKNNSSGTAIYVNKRYDSYISCISTLTAMEVAP
jgi:hypothetical protein